MKIKCDDCGRILFNPPLTEKYLECMDIINNEKEYVKERQEIIEKFFKVYSKELNKLQKIENELTKLHYKRLKSINEEKHKVSEKFDVKVMEDYKEWKK